MAEVKLTKNGLRAEQSRWALLQKYLPTLQLKKAMLQGEVSQARLEIDQFYQDYSRCRAIVDSASALFTDALSFDLLRLAQVERIERHYESIAGVEVPYLDKVVFTLFPYSLFDTPVWVDSAQKQLQALVTADWRVRVAKEKKRVLEQELREVSIRVNLFEKVLIPRAEQHIKRIKVFLADQQLAAVARAKVAKAKR